MSDVTLGTILTGTHHRDAIHIAIAPVFAADKLSPGEEVGFIDAAKTRVGKSPKPLGIVDPFLTADVRRDEQFYLWLFPQTVTGMRHEWQHPEFPAPTVTPSDVTKQQSEQWLRDFARGGDCPPFEELIAAATGRHLDDVDGYGASYHNRGDYLHFSGRDAHGEIPAEFWDHVENYTGVKIPAGKRAEWFSCSC